MVTGAFTRAPLPPLLLDVSVYEIRYRLTNSCKHTYLKMVTGTITVRYESAGIQDIRSCVDGYNHHYLGATITW
jgi:hypothetical protein